MRYKWLIGLSVTVMVGCGGTGDKQDSPLPYGIYNIDIDTESLYSAVDSLNEAFDAYVLQIVNEQAKALRSVKCVSKEELESILGPGTWGAVDDPSDKTIKVNCEIVTPGGYTTRVLIHELYHAIMDSNAHGTDPACLNYPVYSSDQVICQSMIDAFNEVYGL